MTSQHRQPYRFETTASTAELRAAHDGLEPGEETGIEVTVAGRVMLHRAQGKLAFATLRDGSGGEIQLFALAAVTADFEGFGHISLGDWVGATGEGEIGRASCRERVCQYV